jgi:hypothetical protein
VAGVTSQQVLYRSTDALGEPIAVSGTVLVPAAPWTGPGSRPLVAYAVGTRGVGDDCAPSYTLTQGADYEGAIVKALLDRGWAVAVSDYQGLGTPGLHTYMVGPAQGHAVLDIARAALRLPGTGLSSSTPVGLMGYSQGGGAAGWAAELAGSYAPDLDVKGSAVGGVPADLTATAEFLDGSPFVAFALLAALGLDTAYPELDLESYLNTRGRELVQTSQQLCLVSVDGFATLISVAFTRFDDYVTTNPLGTPPWQARLAETQLGKAAPSAPVLQYHALFDEIIPSTKQPTSAAPGATKAQTSPGRRCPSPNTPSAGSKAKPPPPTGSPSASPASQPPPTANSPRCSAVGTECRARRHVPLLTRWWRAPTQQPQGSAGPLLRADATRAPALARPSAHRSAGRRVRPCAGPWGDQARAWGRPGELGVFFMMGYFALQVSYERPAEPSASSSRTSRSCSGGLGAE